MKPTLHTITVLIKSSQFDHVKELKSYSAYNLYECFEDLYEDMQLIKAYGVKNNNIMEHTEVDVDGRMAICYSPGNWEVITNMNLDPDLDIIPILQAVFPKAARTQAQYEAEQSAGKKYLTGMKFAISGTLSQPRRRVAKFILENGGDFLPRVTMDTDFIVTGSGCGETKMELADKYHISTITEDELMMMAEGKPLQAGVA